eukprot:TRINITY_DN18243_c0_g1_i2.p1 TRINITY_DN18243_c0_g1~~TRINITY_DN18243_c0_g1_i2.p1  ORF type:complete len:683 (-),score=153.70 TRINITY_DN18243_c0_g1_i2:426-2474(-)
MYSVNPSTFATAAGHGVPTWPALQNAEKGKSDQNAHELWTSWPASNCVWVPAYIVYGLLDAMAPGYDMIAPMVTDGNGMQATSDCKNWQGPHGQSAGCKEGKGNSESKHLLAPEEQEFHQQMLQKLALHLAAQPDQDESPHPETSQCEHSHESSSDRPRPLQLHEALKDTMSEPLNISRQDGKCDTFRIDGPGDSSPSSGYCATPEEHSMPVWSGPSGQPSQTHRQEQPVQPGHGSSQCPQCVWVPTYICYGLLDMGEGKQRPGLPEQEFNQQMLRKLALHLAAQPDGDQPQPGALPQSRGSDAASGGKSSTACEASKWGKDIRRSGQGKGFSLPASSPQEQEFHRDMLQKLALHLAAQPDSPTSSAPYQKPSLDRRHGLADAGKGKARSEKGKGSGKDGGKGTKRSINTMQTNSQQQEFHAEMLKKLALHLAAQPDTENEHSSGEVAQPGEISCEPSDVGEDKARCDRLISDLESSRAQKAMTWILTSARSLSLTQFGSRVVQKAIGLTTLQQREQLAEELLHDAMELYMSPHGNHVLAKLIEVLPSTRLVCIGETMRGQAGVVARHQFGSRILERLIEHCSEDQIGFLMDELLEDLEALARHQFGNFVVQHMFSSMPRTRLHAMWCSACWSMPSLAGRQRWPTPFWQVRERRLSRALHRRAMGALWFTSLWIGSIHVSTQ